MSKPRKIIIPAKKWFPSQKISEYDDAIYTEYELETQRIFDHALTAYDLDFLKAFRISA